MKKVITILAITAFMFSLDANAQEPKQTKKVASTEAKKGCCSSDKKSTASTDKKSCGTEAKSGGCCSSKKSEAKKED